MLPSMRYSDGITKKTLTKFGGYEHLEVVGDGAVYHMKNLGSRRYPALGTRKKRALTRTLEKPNGISAFDRLCWADGGGFYYDGILKGEVADSEKSFCALGASVIIMPDKKYYNVSSGEFGSLEQTYLSGAGEISFGGGTLYGEAASANSIVTTGPAFGFSPGDAVTISGCAVHPENNKTPVIREISSDGRTLRFYENIFNVGSGSGYTEPGAVTLKRAVPDMDFVFQNENRLWGCKGDTLYASKLGDAKNWNVFDGLSTDSYAADVGAEGDFTGACSYLGYPVFFKENGIFKVYGSRPADYQIMASASLGVKAGCHRSLAIAGETLFYLSRAGIAAYGGGVPAIASLALGRTDFSGAAAGSDGLKYYVSMVSSDGERSLFVYDALRSLWHREDESDAMGFAFCGGLYMLCKDGSLYSLDGSDGTEELDFEWLAQSGDITYGSPLRKGVGKLDIRAELAAGAEMSVFISHDGGDFVLARHIAAPDGAYRRPFHIPLIPRRCDSFRLRLSGTGEAAVYSISVEMYEGSELK